MLRSDPQKRSELEDKLKEIYRGDTDFTPRTGVIFEFFMKTFGWSDFILSLWSSNSELLKDGIIVIRECCNFPLTSSIIGNMEEDGMLRTLEMKYISSKVELSKSSSIAEIARENNIRNYIALQKGILSKLEGITESYTKDIKGDIEYEDNIQRIVEKIFEKKG